MSESPAMREALANLHRGGIGFVEVRGLCDHRMAFRVVAELFQCPGCQAWLPWGREGCPVCEGPVSLTRQGIVFCDWRGAGHYRRRVPGMAKA